MLEIISLVGFWGHAAAGFLFATLAIWIFQQYGSANRQQIMLIIALALTAAWGIITIITGPTGYGSPLFETLRNMGWLGFLYALLKSAGAAEQPRTIVMIYVALALVLLCQPMVDGLVVYARSTPELAAIVHATAQSAKLFRMLFAIGAVVLVHNLYTGTAPEARWGLSLPMAALAAMWTFDLNMYTIGYITGADQSELISMRGIGTALLSPVFAMASRRNSNWRIRLSRSVTFQSVSLMAIGAYLLAMIVLATAIQLVGGDYAQLAQITVIFGMSLIALIVMPSGKFRAWLNVVIAKNFFQLCRYNRFSKSGCSPVSRASNQIACRYF
jgi:hypothetical protein